MKIVDAGCAVVAGVAGPAVAATPDDDLKRHAALSLSDLCATLGGICTDLSRQDAEPGRDSPCQRSLPVAQAGLGAVLAPGVCEVLPHLLLGGAAALRPGLLATLGINCVINCAAELANFPVPENVTYLRAPLADHPSAALDQHLDTVADAIEEVRLQGGRTLVHCLAGVSRSAAMVLGYLVKHHAMPLASAFALVRAARPAARPNSGFCRQLIDWERLHLGVETVRMVEHPALAAPIPDVYLEDYRNTLLFHNKYSNRACGGR